MRSVAIILVAAVLGACGSSPAPEPTDRADGSTTLEVFGPYRTTEADLFSASLAQFSATTGIDVRYTGSGSFESDLRGRALVTADLPDVALVPQPGLVAELADRGSVRPLDPTVVGRMEEHIPEAARVIGEVDGVPVGVPYRSSVKSLVWYRPEVLADAGYRVPRSLAELDTLVDRAEEDGWSPWCLAIESESATGWVATDWVEDLLIRNAGPDVYAGWVDGSVPFSDERVETAFNEFRSLALDPGRALGGTNRILRTAVEDAADPLLTDPPGCLLHRQASFATGWLPEGTVVGPDGVDFFVLPPAEPDEQPPLVVGADLAVALTDSPESQALLAYLATPESGRPWAASGGFTGFWDSVDPARFYTPVEHRVVDLLIGTDVLVADGSDSMPPPIGTELLWDQISLWVAGSLAYEELAGELDAARDALP